MRFSRFELRGRLKTTNTVSDGLFPKFEKPGQGDLGEIKQDMRNFLNGK